MAFVGAAILPHSPLLLPTIGREYTTQTKRTLKARAAALAEIHALQPDSIIVIHPHGQKTPGAMTINLADQLSATFSEFGDMVTTANFKVDTRLAHEIKEQAEDAGWPLAITHDPKLSYDAAIPLLDLPGADTIPILPLSTSDLAAPAHANFGRVLADVLYASSRRIAVVISAELSQHASAAAPKGLRPEGEQFDAAIVKNLNKKPLMERWLNIPDDVIEQAEACGYLPLLMLSGLIAKSNCHVRKLSYEHPFGIGLLVAIIHPA